VTSSIDTSVKTVARALAAMALAVALVACSDRAEDRAPVAPSTEVAAVDTPTPAYPMELACAGVGGEVIVSLAVGVEGTPTEVRLVRSSGNEALDQASLEGVRVWKFKPATRGGQPQPTTIQVPVSFNVPQPRPEACFALDAKR
jgi:protein TonB